MEITRSGATWWAMRQPVGAIRTLDGFDVLAADQRQQRDRLRGSWPEFLIGQIPSRRCASLTSAVNQQVASGLVIPGDRRLTRVVIVVGACNDFDDLGGAGDLAADPADRGDQLGHRVLGGDRVVEDRGIQSPPGLPPTPRSRQPPL